LQRGGGLEAFEELIGPVEQIQSEWHDHVQKLKARLIGKSRKASLKQTEISTSPPSQ
jgi:hypothetical protein